VINSKKDYNSTKNSSNEVNLKGKDIGYDLGDKINFAHFHSVVCPKTLSYIFDN
jgi:hypothetical protein